MARSLRPKSRQRRRHAWGAWPASRLRPHKATSRSARERSPRTWTAQEEAWEEPYRARRGQAGQGPHALERGARYLGGLPPRVSSRGHAAPLVLGRDEATGDELLVLLLEERLELRERLERRAHERRRPWPLPSAATPAWGLGRGRGMPLGRWRPSDGPIPLREGRARRRERASGERRRERGRREGR